MKIGRRRFVGLGSAALAGLSLKGEKPVKGSFVNDSVALGHDLRDRVRLSAPKRVEKVRLLIVGGGIAGLSAAWRLKKRNFNDFILLEMNPETGGNARWGQNEITAFPWAAHYVPVPGPKAGYVRELFEDLGVLKNGQWEERYRAYSPQERLFLFGRWQEGLEPSIGLTPKDREQFERLWGLFSEFRQSGGFTIPVAAGRDPRFRKLDNLSFSAWLAENRFDSKFVRWYMNYACRDDYGALAGETSAWAGIHYFSSREIESQAPLTWPEGNGWIARRLMELVRGQIRTGQRVDRIEPGRRQVTVSAGEIQYRAELVIFAAPTFLAPYLIEGFPRLPDFVYSPWLTANLTLERYPRSQAGEPAWDNVFFDSPALGYVDAMHQSLGSHPERTVWTFYWALAEGSPAQNRQLLLEKDWNFWKEAILGDLERVHADIRQCVSRVDLMRMGHAMVRPAVGSIFSENRRRLSRRDGTVLFANSDLSGISLFEEAQYQGVEAADKALSRLGGSRGAGTGGGSL